MDKLDFREIANAKISSRIRQVIILMVAIIIGMILSLSVNAQHHDQKEKVRHQSVKFKTQLNRHENACSILAQKQIQKTKPFFRSASKKTQKSMAEIESATNKVVTPLKKEITTR